VTQLEQTHVIAFMQDECGRCSDCRRRWGGKHKGGEMATREVSNSNWGIVARKKGDV